MTRSERRDLPGGSKGKGRKRRRRRKRRMKRVCVMGCGGGEWR